MRWLLALWLAIAPACAQEAIIGSGVYASKSTAASYSGPGDIVSSATMWVGVRAYTAAIAAAATQKLLNVRNTGTSETCDILVATNGGFATTVSNCSGSSSGTAVATFCTGGCAITDWYDQSGNSNDISQATAAAQPTLTFSCIGSLPCLSLVRASNQALQGGTTGSVSQPWTISAVGERTGSTTSFSELFTPQVSAPTLIGWTSAANTFRFFAGSTLSVTANSSVWHAFNAAAPTSTGTINVDGTETSGTVGTNTVGGANAWLVPGSNHLTGNITEAGTWGSSFSSGNRTSMCQNQQAYYGSGNFGAAC